MALRIRGLAHFSKLCPTVGPVVPKLEAHTVLIRVLRLTCVSWPKCLHTSRSWLAKYHKAQGQGLQKKGDPFILFSPRFLYIRRQIDFSFLILPVMMTQTRTHGLAPYYFGTVDCECGTERTKKAKRRHIIYISMLIYSTLPFRGSTHDDLQLSSQEPGEQGGETIWRTFRGQRR